jgi:hypothetical protein
MHGSEGGEVNSLPYPYHPATLRHCVTLERHKLHYHTGAHNSGQAIKYRHSGRSADDDMLVMLVPKLQLGDLEGEAPASRDVKLELPQPNSQAGAWELATS